MDNQDHTRTHTPGHGNHGVHLCHKCGWPFPNPHPSAKHRRAHKKICGTIEGYKLLDLEGTTRSNGSDDEHLPDDDHKTPSPTILETGNNENGDDGVGEKSNRSEDEVFTDAVADLSESGLSSGVEEPLQNISISVTNIEEVDRKDPTISKCFEEKGFNAADISPLTVKPSDEFRMQNLEVLQNEQDLVGNIVDIKGQPSDSTVDPLWSSVSDSRTKDSTVGECDDSFGLQSDTHPSKAEAVSDALEENKVYAGEKVTDYSLTSVVSSNDIVSEAYDSLPKVEDSDAVISDHEVADGAVKKEKDSIKFFPEVSHYDLPLEIDSAVNAIVTTNDSQVKTAPVSRDGTSSDLVKTLPESGERNFDVESEDSKDHNRVELRSPLTLSSSQALKHEEGDLKETTTEENYSDFNSRQLPEETQVLSPDVQVVNDTINQEQVNCEPVAEEMPAEERSEFSSVKLKDDGVMRSDEIGFSVDAIKSEMESHTNHFSGIQDSDNSRKSEQLNLPEDSVIGPSDEYEDFKDQEQVSLQYPLSLLSSEALRHEDDDLKDANAVENHSGFDTTQLLVGSEILSPDMHLLDYTIKQDQGDCEPVVKKQAEFFPVQLTVDDKQISDKTGVSMDVTKPDVYDSCVVNIPGEQESDDVCKNSKQVNLSEGSLAVPTDDSPGDAPIDSATCQTTSVNSMDATSQSEKNAMQIDVDGNVALGETNEESDVAIRILEPSNLLQFEVKASNDVFEDDGADEQDKREKWDVTDAQCGEVLVMAGNSLPKSGSSHFEFPVASEDVMDGSARKPTVVGCTNIDALSVTKGDCELVVEKQAEVFPVQLTIDNKQSSDETGVPVDVTKPDVYDSCMVNISGEQESDDVHKNSKQVNLSEGSVVVPTDESLRDAPIDSATCQTISAISMDATSQSENNATEIDANGNGMLGGTDEESDAAIRIPKPSNLLQFEVKSSSDVCEDDGADERGKSGERDMTHAQCGEGLIMTAYTLPESRSNHFESPIASEDAMDGSARKPNAIEFIDKGALSITKEDVKDDMDNSSQLQEEHVSSVSDLHRSRDAELLVKAPENHTKEDPSLPPIYTEHSMQNDSDPEDNLVRDPAGKASGNCAAPIQDQSSNDLVKQQLSSSRTDASIYSGSRCDSLEGNWGSVSVFSVQSDAPAVIDVESLPSTDFQASTESRRSNLNNPEALSEGQQCEKSEMFEPPSFMTLVESGHAVGPKAAASEVQKDKNSQDLSSTLSQPGWFPTLTQVVNESQGRKKNEEIIAKVTNWSTSKQHIPLKSLLGEAAQSNKQKSPKHEENQLYQMDQKVLKDDSSGLTTVNSILRPESPAALAAKVEAEKEWNSPARYPAGIKREKRKVKSRPYWMQFVCCTTVDHQHI